MWNVAPMSNSKQHAEEHPAAEFHSIHAPETLRASMINPLNSTG
jgi:hypothetical protein